MADQPNGLASLTQARQRARRTMPPPRHPAAARHLTSADTPPDHQPHDSQTDEPVPAAPAQPAHAAVVPEQAGPVAVEVVPATSGTVEPPVKMTFYVDQAMDRYLEDVRIQGLTSRPKVDVSRSAVVRLALRRLREEMTPEQVKALLAAQPTDPTRTGRKRR